MFDTVNKIVSEIKNKNPLILNITNDVTMDFVANGLLSLGASPIMSNAMQEIGDLLQLANAVVINIGTLNNDFVELCEHTCLLANQFNKPIIFDPVGAGATLYRTHVCQTFLKNYSLAIIRGNASEIGALSGASFTTKGVDSEIKSDIVIDYAHDLSLRYDVALCMSGKTDVIIEQKNKVQFTRGSSFMPKVTGTGCLLSAVIGAFHAVEKNRFSAASSASLFFSVCGEIAAEKSEGPASFKTHFLDALNIIPAREYYENS